MRFVSFAQVFGFRVSKRALVPPTASAKDFASDFDDSVDYGCDDFGEEWLPPLTTLNVVSGGT